MKHSLLETAIGAVVLLVAGIFLVFSYSTANNKSGGLTSGIYHVTAVFDNIGGLKVGDNVMISGVKVGSVDQIKLDEKLYRAQVRFNVTNTIKLAKDSSARIASESLLGGRYLDVQPGGDENDLKNGDIISMTQSATNLEDLLGRFIFSAANGTKKDAASAPAANDAAPDMPDAAADDSADHP